MASSRASALTRIMEIENQIKRLLNSKKYRNIQSSITLLKNRTGNAIFEVQNPEDQNKTLEVRRNSKESWKILSIYETQFNEYQTLLNELGKKKKILTQELFK